MYCPRCGTQANDSTKFCRNCGLALTPLTGYVASGGTLPLQPEASESSYSKHPLVQAFLAMEPKRQMTFSILFFVFLIPLLAILGGIIPPLRALVPLAALGMPLGIVWSVMRYKAMKRHLQEQHYPDYAQSVAPPSVPQRPAYQPPLAATPTTNQLEDPRSYQTPIPNSVTEEETRRLPDRPRREST